MNKKHLSIINDYEQVICYFNLHQYQQFGYINYRRYADVIQFVLKLETDYQIRKIFYMLIKLGYVEKIDQSKSRRYLYKYNNPEHERIFSGNKKIKVIFD